MYQAAAPRPPAPKIGARTETAAAIHDSVILEGAIIEPGASVERSILGPGARASGRVDRIVAAGGESKPVSVLSRGEEERILRFLALSANDPVANEKGRPRFRILQGDGSSRQIVRAVLAEESRIVVVSPPEETEGAAIYPRRTGSGVPNETEAYVYIASYLQSLGVPAPEVYQSDGREGLLLLEDLGDKHLYDLVRVSGSGPLAAEVVSKYEEAVTILLRMQNEGSTPFDPERTHNLPYDLSFVLRYESGYFHREMVQGLCALSISPADLESEYGRAAREALAGAPLRFMHRDYQSRNLMVAPRGLVVIDIQGARLGPPEYDLASLLLDPYVSLPAPFREELLRRYLAGIPEDEAETRRRYRASGINRMLQALGAFAYLGGKLGKPGFLEHVPAALTTLKELTGTEYPRLHDLVSRLQTIRPWS